jgi:hypothetical protein
MNQTCYCRAQLLVVVSKLPVEYIMKFNVSVFFFFHLLCILTGHTINELPNVPSRYDRIDISCFGNSSSYKKTELWRFYIYIECDRTLPVKRRIQYYV